MPQTKAGEANPHSRKSRASPSNAALTDQWFQVPPVEGGHHRCLRFGVLLISSSRVDSTATLRVLQMQPRRGHLVATLQRPY
jgi:hypothetical protein